MSARTKHPTSTADLDRPAAAPDRFGEVLRFHAEASSTADSQAVYDVLADLSTHLTWGGPESANRNQALMTLEAPPGPATLGTTFTSTGKAGRDTFHDRSTVTSASPGERFGFRTQSRLERARRPVWQVVFTHDYQLSGTAQGSTVRYSCAVRPVNYLPYWLQPGLKVLTRVVVSRLMTKNLRGLARLAEEHASAG